MTNTTKKLLTGLAAFILTTGLTLGSNNANAYTHQCFIQSWWGLDPNLVYRMYITETDRVLFDWSDFTVFGTVFQPFNDTEIIASGWNPIENFPSLHTVFFISSFAIYANEWGSGQVAEEEYAAWGLFETGGDVCSTPLPVWLNPI